MAVRITLIAMKVVALVSGGKDSTFNMLCCQHEGHQVSTNYKLSILCRQKSVFALIYNIFIFHRCLQIVALANLHPADKGIYYL